MDAKDALSRPLLDRSAALLAEGYAWLPNRMRESPASVVRTRLLGRPTLAVRGPEAVRFFYDERNVRRGGSIPEPVLSTLFGHEAVHTLDGTEHRARKQFFLPLLEPESIAGVTEQVADVWDEAVEVWGKRSRVQLFEEVSRVLTRGVSRWAGIPGNEAADLDDPRLADTARDMIAMIDGFATAGPRHWRARGARRRQEERLERLIKDVRAGRVTVREGCTVDRVRRHRDADGEELSPRAAAVELLNVVRPSVALSWFVTFAAHALHRWPENRERLRQDDAAFVAAFVHEIRRFYPFAPFLGGHAVTDLTWKGHHLPKGGLVLLDVYGQNHDHGLWADPYRFRPERFLERPVDRDELIPQGGGDTRTGHRCPGEGFTIGLLEALTTHLARLDHQVPDQDLRIPLRRIPARVKSGFVVTDVRPWTGR